MSNEQSISDIKRILTIFHNSQGEIRPHFIMTGASGSGKTHIILALTEEMKMPVIDVNAAQLTKEGTSGNSLSKALVPLENYGSNLVVVFVDEFDKLFISGNNNASQAHEATNGVQNEFLKVLEGKTTRVFGDYGKYNEVQCDNALFIFAGAFNGEENIDLDRLRAMGLKTEFLGRVGLTFALEKITLEDLAKILNDSKLLADYLQLFPKYEKEDVTGNIMEAVESNYELNTIGVRILHTLIHQYFISGGKLDRKEVKQSTFQTMLH